MSATPIEKLAVQLRLDHTYIGDLIIRLIPPSGRGLSTTTLHNRAGGRTRNIDRLYDASTTSGLSAYAGKRCDGRWTIRVEDRAAVDSGTLIQIGLQLSLPPAVPPAGAATPHAAAGPGRRRAVKKKVARRAKTAAR